MFCTVASQPMTPRGFSHAASKARRLASARFTSWACAATSAEAVEIAEDGVELIGGQRGVRHVVARLERLRIGNPARPCALAVREHAGREGAATEKVRQVRSRESERCDRAPDAMAGGASAVDEQPLPAPRLLVERRLRRLALILEPRGELGRA